MLKQRDYDLVVVGDETEGVLAAIAAGRAGATAALLIPPLAGLGGLLTDDGLAFVDRDARHLIAPEHSPHDGLFGEFLARAEVPLVALEAEKGRATLALMLKEAGVTVIREDWLGVKREGAPLTALTLKGESLSARFFIDATPDGDLAEAAGMRFADAFQEVGLSGALGISPLPLVRGVTPETILETCKRLALDSDLVALQKKTFGDRKFLDLDAGADYVLLGPPHLGLSYQRWRQAHVEPGPYRFEADGFNVAVLGPTTTSWNGLIYFSDDPSTRLRLSRDGADAFFIQEAKHFERFLITELGWNEARVSLPRGVYVRQTRHALDVRHRLRLAEIAAGYSVGSVGTFCYYPDFRGFHGLNLPGPLTAHVILDAGLAAHCPNLGLASRAAGYTPFAHSLCRLVQYNATLGAALGVASALAKDDFSAVPSETLRSELAYLGLAANDPLGLALNEQKRLAMQADPLLCLERAVSVPQ